MQIQLLKNKKVFVKNSRFSQIFLDGGSFSALLFETERSEFEYDLINIPYTARAVLYSLPLKGKRITITYKD